MSRQRSREELQNLERWLEQASSPKPAIPPQIQHLLWLKADNLLTPEETTELDQVLAESPELRTELEEIQSISVSTISAGEVSETLLQRILDRRTREKERPVRPRLSVVCTASGLQWKSRVSAGESIQFQMARSADEPCSRLEEMLTMNCGRLLVTIETDAEDTFVVSTTLQTVAPKYSDAPLKVILSGGPESRNWNSVFESGMAIFEDVPAGEFSLRLITDQVTLDEIELLLGSDK